MSPPALKPLPPAPRKHHDTHPAVFIDLFEEVDQIAPHLHGDGVELRDAIDIHAADRRVFVDLESNAVGLVVRK